MLTNDDGSRSIFDDVERGELTFAEMKGEFRLCFDGDPWGTAMSWWFTIADEIYHNRSFDCPASWLFRPSPMGASNDPDDYVTGIVEDARDDDLARFGALIDRYARALKHAGHDY